MLRTKRKRILKGGGEGEGGGRGGEGGGERIEEDDLLKKSINIK